MRSELQEQHQKTSGLLSELKKKQSMSQTQLRLMRFRQARQSKQRKEELKMQKEDEQALRESIPTSQFAGRIKELSLLVEGLEGKVAEFKVAK
mmetsp:Transcript_15214/g.23500  ORF Transcript_15214/g.23500 Transcript_15214/m.23500 type:complete len:93 (+) Transcript_15214:678-956(+)